MKAFFILDKWCAANKNWGESAWETNFVSSFASLQKYEYSVFHFDEFHDQFPGENANSALIKSLKQDSPDFIFLVIYQKPSVLDNIISIESLHLIRDQLQIPIVIIFGDLEHKEQEEILLLVEPFMTLILYTALAPPGIRLKSPKIKYSWVPKSSVDFYRDKNIEKIYELTYFGSPKPHRMRLINYLKKNSVPIIVGGGERQENIPVSKYAQYLRESKITLSFSRAEFCHVINARVFEVISCGSMLLEQAGVETPKLFRPFIDFVPFFSKLDCLDKANYYIKNESERLEIADNGYRRCENYFSSQRFWSEIIEFIYYYKKNRKLAPSKTLLVSSDFWSQSILVRSIPTFNPEMYEGYKKILLMYYGFLNRVMVDSNLYLLFIWLRGIIILPRRIFYSAGGYFLGRFGQARIWLGKHLGRD